MRPEDILDAIGDVDDSCVKSAKQKPMMRRVIGFAAALAACLLLVLLLPHTPWHVSHDLAAPENEAQDSTVAGGEGTAEDALQEDDVWIYYVQGDEICRVQEHVSCSPDEIFAVWKEKNGIGDDVRLIEVRIDDNSQTTVSEFQGEGVVKHTRGDCFVYNLTISKTIENYYDSVNRTLLLQSLEQTMTGYSGIEYDEYHLFLK